MADIEHRIPWKIPYAYTSIRYSTDTEEVLDDNKMAELLNHAQTMEILAEQAGYAPAVHPMVQEAVSRGAVRDGDGVPQVPQMRQPATAQQNAEVCPQCGSPGKWDTTKTGKSVLKCTGACKDNVNGRMYAHTIRWGD